jgi:hypothetical protein
VRAPTGVCGLALGLALGLGLLGEREAAAKQDSQWLAEHLAFDVSGAAGWRVAWAENKNPGFHFIGGGGEVNIGLEFDSGFGFLLGTRVLFGRNLGPSGGLVFADLTGQVMGQFRLNDWVRIGLGASGGRFFECCGSEVTPDRVSALAGGFLRIGIDYLPRNTGLPRGLSLWLRIGVDGHPGSTVDSRLPATSMNIGLGSGVRL